MDSNPWVVSTTWDILLDSWFLLEYQIVLSSSEYWTSHGCSLIFMSHVFRWFQQLFSSRNLRYPAVRASREGGVLEFLAILLHAHSQGYSSLTLSSWSSPNFLSWVSLLDSPFSWGWNFIWDGSYTETFFPGSVLESLGITTISWFLWDDNPHSRVSSLVLWGGWEGDGLPFELFILLFWIRI